MRVTIIGTGYVGLVTGAGLADFGNDVTCVDNDEHKVSKLLDGKIPFYEPGLDELVARNLQVGRLRFESSYASVEFADVVMLCVGTPSQMDGTCDRSMLFSAARSVARAANRTSRPIVVVKSTAIPGTGDEIERLLIEALPRMTEFPEGGWRVVSNPEFLKEGSAVHDFFYPDRVVLGGSKSCLGTLRELYEPYMRSSARVIEVDRRTAELAKYASNGMLAARISYMNDISEICEHVGADIDGVRQIVGSDERIGPKFLFAGVGWGGSCFGKDLAALQKLSADLPVPSLWGATESNEQARTRAWRRVHAQIYPKATLGIWGLSFKPKTDDTRDAPALYFIENALRDGFQVRVFDPMPGARERVSQQFGDRIRVCDSANSAAEGAHALMLCTEWPEFHQPDFKHLALKMRDPKLVFDGRNFWHRRDVEAEGLKYMGVGR